MKKLVIALLAAVLFIPAIAFAQNSQQSQDEKNAQQERNQAAQVDEMGGTTLPKHNMTGMVSDNGKTFTSDNKSYVVNNPKSLKNYNGQSVAVVFLFNTDDNTIRILSASPAQSRP